MAATDGPSRRPDGAKRRRRGRGRLSKAIGVLFAVLFPVYGVASIGLGISGLHNGHVLATAGVPVMARVSATTGYGRNTIQVTYLADGRGEQGTVNVFSSGYSVGEVVPVVYDPQSPQVVGLAGEVVDNSSAWSEIIAGGFVLAVMSAVILLTVISARRRRRQAVRAVLGG